MLVVEYFFVAAWVQWNNQKAYRDRTDLFARAEPHS